MDEGGSTGEARAAAPEQWDFCVRLSSAVYPHDRALRACYALSNSCSFWIDKDGDDLVIHGSAKDRSTNPEALRNELLDALLDHALRQRIEQQTADIRSLIVRTALAEATRPPDRSP